MKVKNEKRKALRLALAEEARRQLGKPYAYGALWQEAPKRFDCSSFVQYVYKKIGIAIPRVSIDQAAEGRRVPRSNQQSAYRVGDLIFLRGKVGRYDRRFPKGIGHVVLVTGPDEVIHAKYKKTRGRDAGSVIAQKLSTILKRKDITVIKRFI